MLRPRTKEFGGQWEELFVLDWCGSEHSESNPDFLDIVKTPCCGGGYVDLRALVVYLQPIQVDLGWPQTTVARLQRRCNRDAHQVVVVDVRLKIV